MSNHSISKINMGTFKKIVPENYLVWKYLSVTLLFPSYSLQKHHHNCVKTGNGCEWRAWRIVFWKSGMSLVPWTKWSIWNNSFLNCGCNWKEEAWKKNQGFNGIRTRDLCVIGVLLYQLSYEATHWERGQFVEFISPVRSEMIWIRSIWNNLFLNCGCRWEWRIILCPAPVKLSGQTYFFSDTNCFWLEKCLLGPFSISLFLIFH